MIAIYRNEQNPQLFPKLAPDEIGMLADYGTMTTAFPNDPISHEGVPNHSIYVVLTGRLHVLKKTGSQEVLVAVHLPGDFSGDLLMQIGAPTSASIRPAIPSVVIQIEASELSRIITEHPALGIKILNAFAKRFLEMSKPEAWSAEKGHQEQAGTLATSGFKPLPAPTAEREHLLNTVTSDDHTWASGNDGVEVVMYGDYQCPFTSKAQESLDSLMSTHPIRFTFRHFPLVDVHQYARSASQAAEAAHNQGQFRRYHQALLRTRGDLPEEKLVELAESLGLDVNRFKADIGGERVLERVRIDLKHGAEDGVEITPAIFLNGKRYYGPLAKAAIASAILRLLQLKSGAA